MDRRLNSLRNLSLNGVIWRESSQELFDGLVGLTLAA